MVSSHARLTSFYSNFALLLARNSAIFSIQCRKRSISYIMHYQIYRIVIVMARKGDNDKMHWAWTKVTNCINANQLHKYNERGTRSFFLSKPMQLISYDPTRIVMPKSKKKNNSSNDQRFKKMVQSSEDAHSCPKRKRNCTNVKKSQLSIYIHLYSKHIMVRIRYHQTHDNIYCMYEDTKNHVTFRKTLKKKLPLPIASHIFSCFYLFLCKNGKGKNGNRTYKYPS